MSMPNRLSTAGMTPAKLAIIGVLAVVLVIVVVVQIPSTSSPNQSQSVAQERISNSRTPNPNNRNNVSSELATLVDSPPKVWSELPLETVLAHDPFAAPAWTNTFEEIEGLAGRRQTDAIERESTADRQLLADLQADGVSLVMIVGDQRMARVGQAQIHEGDRIGGFIVEEISTNGVVLIENQAP